MRLLFLVILAVCVVNSTSSQGNIVWSEEIQVTAERESTRGYFFPSSGRYLYPELLVCQTNAVLIGFLDGKGRYVVRSIRDGKVGDFFEMDCYPNGEKVERLPQILTQDDGFVVASVRREPWTNRFTIYFVPLQQNGKATEPVNEFLLPNRRQSSSNFTLESVVTSAKASNIYLVVGSIDEAVRRLSLHPEINKKNCAVALTASTNLPLETIEVKGKFEARAAAYVAVKGTFYSAWIRDSDATLFSKAHSESICYSQRSEAGNWSKPIVLFTEHTKNIYSIADVSIACGHRKTFVMWARDLDGIYYSEIKNGKSATAQRIGDWEGFDSKLAEDIARPADAPCCNIASDAHDNIFAVWVLNRKLEKAGAGRRVEHKIVFRARLQNRWTPEMLVSLNSGDVRSPKIVVDAIGGIHLAYLKRTDSEKFGCFYRKWQHNQ